VVKSIGSGTITLHDDVQLAAGNNVTITPSGQTLTIAASAGLPGWSLTGNAGTTPGVNFLGTTDDEPLELWVNGDRALRLEPNPGGPNVIGGFSGNSVTGLAYGATIAGGGYADSINQVSGNMSTIGGGNSNTVLGPSSTIGGGYSNTVQFVAGSTIGGGGANTIQNGGEYGTIPGGYGNAVAGPYCFAAGRDATASGLGSFVWGDGNAATASSGDHQFVVRCSGGAFFYTSTGTSSGVTLAPGGGSWSNLSDREAKEHFTPVDAIGVLERVAALPVTAWNYRAQDKRVRHIGPVAQDFFAAFGLGEDERHIATVDEEGVALTAIKGLNQKLEAKEVEIQRLKLQNSSLASRLAELEKTVRSLTAGK
jgi:hypothetical protein